MAAHELDRAERRSHKDRRGEQLYLRINKRQQRLGFTKGVKLYYRVGDQRYVAKLDGRLLVLCTNLAVCDEYVGTRL